MRVVRGLFRKSGIRLAKKIIVIVAEGRRTEIQYFEGLQKIREFWGSAIKVEFVDRQTDASDPASLLNELKKFKAKYKLKRNNSDQLWQISDVDNWTQAMLADIARQCLQANFGLAISNPCFEAWLILHLEHERDDAFLNSLDSSGAERELKSLLGGYNKSNLNIDQFSVGIPNAIREAERLDNPEHRWPHSFGSRVYMLMRELMDTA